MKHDPWEAASLYTYWDERSGSVAAFAKKLGTLSEDERTEALQVISKRVASLLARSSDDDLKKAASAVGDDLYKAASAIEFWDDTVRGYLRASAGVFFSILHDRGFRLHYLVDNTFPDLGRPLTLYPAWFEACGIVFISPQRLAADLMEKDGLDFAEFSANLPRYIAEGRHLATLVVEACAQQGRHFVFLDIDHQEDSFATARALEGEDGVITVFRNEAPVPGSAIEVQLPAKAAKSP